MGYTTTFEGRFVLNSKAPAELDEYIQKFCAMRHVKRDVERLKKSDPDYAEKSHPIIHDPGREGQFYIPDHADWTISDSYNIKDNNTAPEGVPGLWCDWTLKDGKYLFWNGSEKFYDYVSWLDYLINMFFKYYDIKLNGSVKWQGEDENDKGNIIVLNNVIRVYSLD